MQTLYDCMLRCHSIEVVTTVCILYSYCMSLQCIMYRDFHLYLSSYLDLYVRTKHVERLLDLTNHDLCQQIIQSVHKSLLSHNTG